MVEIATRDEVLIYLNDLFTSTARDGVNPDFFFEKLKKGLPQNLEDSLRIKLTKKCEDWKNSGTSTKAGYDIVQIDLIGIVKQHYN